MATTRTSQLWITARVGASIGSIAALAVTAAAVYVRSAARGRIFSESGLPITPVGVVLGAQVYPDGTPSPFLAARLELAARLFRAGQLHRLIVSGDHRAREYDEPRAMRQYLIELGIPAEAITEDPDGFDTYESCLRARETYRLGRFALISQIYHLPRAVGTARLLGLDAIGVGDGSVRIQSSGRHSRSWRWGALREQVACLKTLRDLRRRPVVTPR